MALTNSTETMAKEEEKSQRGSRRGRARTRMLRTRLSVFETQIQKNKEKGTSSIPEGIKTGLKRRPSIENEGKPMFFVSPESRRRSLSLRSRNRETLECLSDQLEAVMSSLNDHTTARLEREEEEEKENERSLRRELRKHHFDEESLGTSDHSVSSSSIAVSSWSSTTMHGGSCQHLPHTQPCDEFGKQEPKKKEIEDETSLQQQQQEEQQQEVKQDIAAENEQDEVFSFEDSDDEDSVTSELFDSSRSLKLRQEIEDVQIRLESIPMQTQQDIASLKESFRRKKEAMQQDIHDRLQQMIIHGGSAAEDEEDTDEANAKRQAQIDKSKNTIRLLRTSNADLRRKRQKLQRGIEKLQRQQESLERESEELQEQSRLATIRAYKLKEENENLEYIAQKCQRFCKPLWAEAIEKNKLHGECAERQVKLYQKTIRNIHSHVKVQTSSMTLKDTMKKDIEANEKELNEHYKNVGVPRVPLYKPARKRVHWKDLASKEDESDPTEATHYMDGTDTDSSSEASFIDDESQLDSDFLEELDSDIECDSVVDDFSHRPLYVWN